MKVSQKVTVTVTEVDLPRKRIALSMKSKPDLTPRAAGGGGARQGNSRPGGSFGAARPAQSRNSGNGGGLDWFTAAMTKDGKK